MTYQRGDRVGVAHARRDRRHIAGGYEIEEQISEEAMTMEKLGARLAQLDEDERAVPVPPEFEAIDRHHPARVLGAKPIDLLGMVAAAAQLEQEAHTLRELGRYGQRALGEGEDLVQALWGIADRLGEVGDEIDRIAHRIDEDEIA